MNELSEIVGDRTWWLEKLVSYDVVSRKVDHAHSGQRLAVLCQVLKKVIVISISGIMYAMRRIHHFVVNHVDSISPRHYTGRGLRCLYLLIWLL